MKRLFFLALYAVLLCGCPHDSGSSVFVEGLDLSEDFVEIMAEGQTTLLGTNDTAALSKERPLMPVLLGQNFYIGKHEVTCGEFNRVMKNVSGLQVECENKNMPAADLTFFDAVLYANAGSKAEKRDTVYTYRQAVFDTYKNCISLEGLVFHPEKEGYRLPTEAEWVYVAGQNWNPDGEWLGGNSGGARHEVCSYETAREICDMTGNVKEWVNDWMSPFLNSTVVNYVGTPNGGSSGNRVLKGGCFNKDASSVTLFSRGDVYPVTSSTKNGYVGFRLAYGAIPNATWVDWNGQVDSDPMQILVNPSTIRSQLGTIRAKLAFRNDNSGNLAFLDYSQATTSIVEIADTMQVYHPEISPDGEKVAFCTVPEGSMEKSALYVRNLDEVGSGLVKLNVESAAIPRWRVFGSDTVILYVTSAKSNRDENEFLQMSTWMVPFSAGAFGTPTQLFNGAFHDGLSEDLSFAVTGSELLRVKKASPGKTILESSSDMVWYGGDQACNASLAKDGTKRVSFLDFAGKIGTGLVGKNYYAHQYLLVADSLGNIIKMVQAPSGTTFDHAEWASGFVVRNGIPNSNYVVATLANANGAHTKIALVNVNDESIVELVEGSELWHPNIWVKSGFLNDGTSKIDYDSAGVYYVDGGVDRAKILRYRLEYFWKYKDSSEFMGLGSSRTSNGFDPFYLKSVEYPLNLAYFFSNFYDIYEFYSRYVRNNAKKLKYVLISLDIDFWYNPYQDNFFNSDYKNFPGYVYDENHNYWRNEDYSFIAKATTEGVDVDSYREVFGNNRSSLFDDIKGWGGQNPFLDFDSCWMDYFQSAYEMTLSRFFDFMRMTAEDSVIVIGVIFPQAPGYKNTGAFGRYGLRRGEASVIIQAFHDMQTTFPHFVFMDENKMGDHDYQDNGMAQDEDHLSPAGARHFTERLDSLIQTLKPLR